MGGGIVSVTITALCGWWGQARSLTHALITLLTYIQQLHHVHSFIHFDSLTAEAMWTH